MLKPKYTARILALLLALCLTFAGCNAQSPEETSPTDGSFTEATEDATGGITDAPTDKPTEGQTEADESDGKVIIPADPEKPASDPYANVNKADFYANYEPADSYWDAYYRTQHGLMSGSIDEQDQEPTLSDERPVQGEHYLRNSSALYSKDKNAYYIVDAKGRIVNCVYKGGAYVTLEEVAAYVFAFGDTPANYIDGKRGDPETSIWGEYLRLNNSAFSGSTTKYPYQPVLPDISGCGGDLYYYEIDIGTTGTDSDPAYRAADYNDGSRITRGAARIVYTRYDANRNNIIDINEKYLFYTYNHYNDFQEYLNYEGGWGEIFGNITGGGKISSKTDYNPTPYVPSVRYEFVEEFVYESESVQVRVEFAYFALFDRRSLLRVA